MTIPIIDTPFYREPWFSWVCSLTIATILVPYVVAERKKRKERSELVEKTKTDHKQIFDLYKKTNNAETAIQELEELISNFSKMADLDLYARIKFDIGYCYSSLFEKSKKEALIHNATSCFEDVISITSLKKNPVLYIDSIGNVASCYCALSEIRNKKENLENAIKSFNSLLGLHPQTQKTRLSGTHLNMGLALSRLGEIFKPEENLELSLHHLNLALEIIHHESSDESIFLKGTALNNLGIAHLKLSNEKNRRENLIKGIDFFQKAFEFRTLEGSPELFADTQNNLAAAFQSLSEIENKKLNLENALDTYKTVLKVKRDEYFTARAKGMMGILQSELSDTFSSKKERIEQLQQSAQSFRECLEFFNPTNYPIDWAIGIKNYGIFLKKLARAKEDSSIFLSAIEQLKSALKIYSKEKYALNHAVTQMDIGSTYLELFNFEKRRDYLENSKSALLIAVGIFQEEKSSDSYITSSALLKNTEALLSILK